MILDINGTKREVAEGSTYRDLALQYQSECPHEILLAFQGNRLQELGRPVEENGGAIRFVTGADPIGMRAYRSSMTFLALKSFRMFWAKRQCATSLWIFPLTMAITFIREGACS